MTAEWPVHFSPNVVRGAFGAGSLSSYTLALEAWRRGLSVTFHAGDLRKYSIDNGDKVVRFDDSRPNSITRPVDSRRLIQKWDTKRFLEEAGAPVPKGRLLRASQTSLDELQKIAEEIRYPVVIKPNAGTMGAGVFSNLQSWTQLQTSWTHLVETRHAEEILIEQHYSGDDYRVLVVGSRVVAACLRIPANVVGDGVKSIDELITAKNEVRKLNPRHSRALIRVDYDLERVLALQDLKITSVPTSGERIFLRHIANAAVGGDVQDVTEQLPDPIKEAAVKATAAFPNIVVAGVDFLYRTGTSPTPDNFTIIEMNVRPHIPVNMYPTIGTGQDVPKDMMDYFFPDSPRQDIPGVENLKFDLHLIRETLRAGVVSELTIKPLPEHYYPQRRRIMFSNAAAYLPLSTTKRGKVQKLANQLGISGSLRRKGKNVQLIAAAATLDSIETLAQRIGTLLNTGPDPSQRWNGAVTTGFRCPSLSTAQDHELASSEPGGR